MAEPPHESNLTMEQSIGREGLSEMTQKADWWGQHLEDSVAICGERLQEAKARRLELERCEASEREIDEALRYEHDQEETWVNALRLLNSHI
jgi:hypothetical protein